MKLRQLYKPSGSRMSVAAFMSGTGSNLRKIIENQEGSGYEVVMVFSDVCDERKCNAKKIAEEFGIAYYCSDIKEFYRMKRANRKDMQARKEYDRETEKLLQKHDVDVVALCGYMSIVSEEICGKYLTLNVHPADLRVIDSSGKRRYAGCMGADCIRRAIEDGGKEARSSTHIVTTEVDGGPVLMVSDAVAVEASGNAGEYHEELKRKGDWKIYPETLKRLAAGNFWTDEEGFAIDLAEEKQLIRSKMAGLRERLSENEVKEKSAAITARLLQLPEYKKAKTVMLYMGVNKEVQTEKAVKEALSEKRVAVPVTDTEKGAIIPSAIERFDELRPGAFGILEPMEARKIKSSEIEIVVVPGIAFDEQGNRVGYGLGYYDRFLKEVAAVKIGLAYELQILDDIRATGEDVAMDKIITEGRVIEVGK